MVVVYQVPQARVETGAPAVVNHDGVEEKASAGELPTTTVRKPPTSATARPAFVSAVSRRGKHPWTDHRRFPLCDVWSDQKLDSVEWTSPHPLPNPAPPGAHPRSLRAPRNCREF